MAEVCKCVCVYLIVEAPEFGGCEVFVAPADEALRRVNLTVRVRVTERAVC